MDASTRELDDGGEVTRRPYVPPTLEHHEDWQVITGQPISPEN